MSIEDEVKARWNGVAIGTPHSLKEAIDNGAAEWLTAVSGNMSGLKIPDQSDFIKKHVLDFIAQKVTTCMLNDDDVKCLWEKIK